MNVMERLLLAEVAEIDYIMPIMWPVHGDKLIYSVTC